MERLGLVGLPNSGKSSLFNALTGASTVVAPHPFSTTETAVALAQVPDERVDCWARCRTSKKLVYTDFEIVDIAALVQGASSGEGLGNRFLGSLRDCDAILFVLRAFADGNVPGDPTRSPTSTPSSTSWCSPTSRRSSSGSTSSGAAAKGDKSLAARDRRARARASPCSATACPLYRSELAADDRVRCSAPVFLLTNKPVLVVVNIGDDQLDDVDDAGGAGRSTRRVARRRARGVPRARGRARVVLDPDGPRRAARRPRARRERRARVSRVRRTTCSAGARSSRRATRRSRAWTFRAGREGARVRGRDPLRPAARLHPRRGDRLGGAPRRSARGRRRRSRASCGSRARTTRSSTATCSRSGSTCDGDVDGRGSCATVTCSAVGRDAPRPPGAAAHAGCSDATASTACSCSGRAARSTPSACGSRSTSRSATPTARCSARAASRRGGSRRVVWRSRVRGRGRGGRVRAMGPGAR